MWRSTAAPALCSSGLNNKTIMHNSHLDIAGLSKQFRDLEVIKNLDLAVMKGELVSLLGPSGCGKSTLLRIIAGLIKAEHGDVILSGKNVTSKPAHKRNISVVFQNYALFPHLTVANNVAFGLRARGVEKRFIDSRVNDGLALVRMTEYADRSVMLLSGGQQQRVAVARALVVEPELLLLDEPFSALDRKLRESMQVELKNLLRDRGITAIFVTHDQEEALAVSDRIAVMSQGCIEQFGLPAELYSKPSTPFVLDFVGLSTNLIGSVVEKSSTMNTVSTTSGVVHVNGSYHVGEKVIVAVRPELMRVNSNIDESISNTIKVTVDDVMFLGSKTLVHGLAPDQQRIVCEIPGKSLKIARGDVVSMSWLRSDTLIYSAA